MLIEVLVGLLGFALGVASTALTFGISLSNRVTTACADLKNLSANLQAHINSEPRQCMVHEAVDRQLHEIEKQVTVNTTTIKAMGNTEARK